MATRTLRPSAPIEAYVLHSYDWSESSLIVELFTRSQGRIVVAAKGAKRPHSQLRAVLLPFQRLLVSVTQPRSAAIEASEVRTLRQAEWAGGVPMVGGAALFAGFYLNELLMKLLARHDPHETLFDAYTGTLPLLASREEAHAEAALRAFELRLLRETGVLPDLSLVTTTQQPLHGGQLYRLDAESGVIPAVGGTVANGLEGATLVRLEAALAHGEVSALTDACLAALPALKAALRNCLHYHLGSSILRTRQVMLELQKLPGAPDGPP